MSITGILDDFLGEDRMVQTVSGRMGSGNFEFYVSDYQKSELIEKAAYPGTEFAGRDRRRI